MRTPEERIRQYRLRAEEVRTAAENMRYADNRATFLRIARDYDLLADNLEGQIKRGLLQKTLSCAGARPKRVRPYVILSL